MNQNDVKIIIEKELFTIGFIRDNLYDYPKTLGTAYTKRGDCDFQLAVLIIGLHESILYPNEKCFSVFLSFEVRTRDGMLKYLRPYTLNKKDGLYNLNDSNGMLSFRISSAKEMIIDSTDWDIKQAKCWQYESVESFIKYLKTDVVRIVDKYINPINHLEYLIDLCKSSNKYHLLFVIAVMHEQFRNTKEAIDCLEKYIEWRLGFRGMDEDELQRTKAYLAHLKYGTPLPYIPFPNDTVSIFNLTGKDIYVAINKKAIKDTTLLEYFITKESFAKPKKVAIDDSTESSGIIISKLGKWSILKISLDVIQELEQEKLETILQTLSSQYTQAILFVNQNTTATFGFEMYKKGETIRKWMSGDGEVFENIGKPLRNEKKLFLNTLTENTDEQSITSFLDTILKITQSDLDNSKSLYYELK